LLRFVANQVWAWLGLSLWMTALFGTCVVHELIHRRSNTQAVAGYVLAGATGYPILGAEHLAHHARPGSVELAEVPAAQESLWSFAGRRLRRIAREQLGAGAPVWGGVRNSPATARAHWAWGSFGVMLMACAAAGGVLGALLFVLVGIGVAFGVQIITYVQHWGLGEDNLGDAVAFGRGWEDDCRFQAWITLNISLQDGHHQDARLPYYRLGLTDGAPRLPAGYVVLMFVSLVPPLWSRLMGPSLERWRLAPGAQPTAGRRLTCFVASASHR
jgi:fatty acid desaturase